MSRREYSNGVLTNFSALHMDENLLIHDLSKERSLAWGWVPRLAIMSVCYQVQLIQIRIDNLFILKKLRTKKELKKFFDSHCLNSSFLNKFHP